MSTRKCETFRLVDIKVYSLVGVASTPPLWTPVLNFASGWPCWHAQNRTRPFALGGGRVWALAYIPVFPTECNYAR